MAAGVARSSLALLAVLFIASGVVAGVTGTKYKGQSEVKRGQAFNVTCTVPMSEGVTWMKDGKELTAELQPFVKDEQNITNNSVEATLTIKNAKTEHAGSYQCNAQHSADKHSVRIISDVTLTGVYDLEDIRMLDLGRTSFNLTCRVEQPTGKPVTVNWFKENVPVSNTTLKDRYQLTIKDNDYVLNIKPVQEDDYGNYTCKLQDSPDVTASFKVYGKPYVRLHPNQNVVEGQKIKIICTVIGKPYATLSWMYNNDTLGAANETIVSSERISFTSNEQGVENGVLVLTDAVPGDYGKYYCQGNSVAGDFVHVAATTLRVKDKYAALWPFIGICAEVIVLCAIILVYEKRRSKNTDMEDSDTDNHDQKQPIGNKDTTGLHQRK